MRYGVTIDDIDAINRSTIDALKSLCRRPTIRVVVDDGRPLKDYTAPVMKLSEVGDIMVLVQDSSADKAQTYSQYQMKFLTLVAALGKVVRLWEVGNEINGDWLGKNVYRKAQFGIDECRKRDLTSVVTWFADETFLRALKASNLRPDIALMSCYPTGPVSMTGMISQLPDWLRQISMHSFCDETGVGEFGWNEWTPKFKPKSEIIARFSKFNFGGMWDFQKECTPKSKPLWSVLNRAWEL